jgi:hypothetical protein
MRLLIHSPWGVNLSHQPLLISPRRRVKSIALKSISSTSAINSINLINSSIRQYGSIQPIRLLLRPLLFAIPIAVAATSTWNASWNATSTTSTCHAGLAPLATYPSKEALFEAIQKWSKDRGYAFTIQRSRTLGNGRQKVQYACDRCPIVQPIEPQPERHRATQSRGTGCLFSILAVKTSSSIDWEVKYRPEARFNIHNHSPSQSPAAHPSHRYLSIQAQATTQRLFGAGKSFIYIIY